MMSASLNHCKKMGAEPGRRFLKQSAAKVEPVIIVIQNKKNSLGQFSLQYIGFESWSPFLENLKFIWPCSLENNTKTSCYLSILGALTNNFHTDNRHQLSKICFETFISVS